MGRLTLLILAASLFVVAAPAAAAQGAIEVPLGDSFTIQNGTECPPNAEVRATVVDAQGVGAQVGIGITDPNGHFVLEATLPSSLAVGPAVVTVDCGLEGAVLAYDIEVVANVAADTGALLPYIALAAGIVVIVAMVVVVRRRTKDAESPAQSADVPIEAPPAPVPAPPPVEDQEDDPEYWFWDNETDRGPVKRLACLSDQGFYLHEIPAPGFQVLLDRLSSVGPDVALEQAFFSVPVADIDEIHHRGTQLRMIYQEDGKKVTRNIDLGTEVDGVVDLLSRRVHVVADVALPTG